MNAVMIMGFSERGRFSYLVMRLWISCKIVCHNEYFFDLGKCVVSRKDGRNWLWPEEWGRRGDEEEKNKWGEREGDENKEDDERKRRRRKRREMKHTKNRKWSIIQNFENICTPYWKYFFYIRVNFRTVRIKMIRINLMKGAFIALSATSKITVEGI